MKIIVDIPDQYVYLRQPITNGSIAAKVVLNAVADAISKIDKNETCSGKCVECHNKTFDSMDSQEFICNKYGHIVR